MSSYFSVLVPYVPAKFATKWHPTSETGPFSVLSRGAFKTFDEAVSWARKNLEGLPYEVKEYVS